jgi:hypothetical protein
VEYFNKLALNTEKILNPYYGICDCITKSIVYPYYCHYPWYENGF